MLWATPGRDVRVDIVAPEAPDDATGEALLAAAAALARGLVPPPALTARPELLALGRG